MLSHLVNAAVQTGKRHESWLSLAEDWCQSGIGKKVGAMEGAIFVRQPEANSPESPFEKGDLVVFAPIAEDKCLLIRK
jgi:hypothetical protein